MEPKPIYPDIHGNVKCMYCSLLHGGKCKLSGETMLGIALLRKCKDFSKTGKVNR